MVKIKCFGVAKEIVDNEILQLERPVTTVHELRTEVMNSYPDFSTIKGFMIAVNQEYATEDQLLVEGDEIAIIPPVSGG